MLSLWLVGVDVRNVKQVVESSLRLLSKNCMPHAWKYSFTSVALFMKSASSEQILYSQKKLTVGNCLLTVIRMKWQVIEIVTLYECQFPRSALVSASSETQGLLSGTNLVLPSQFQKWSNSVPLIGQKNIFLPSDEV